MALILNLAASAPPTMAKVGAVPSGSVAVTVATTAVPSAVEAVALAPPPPEVITGVSAALVMVTDRVWVSVRMPSETWTTTW